MRSISKTTPAVAILACFALTLVTACTNKGLGGEVAGTTIGQAKGSRVVLVQPENRKLRPRFSGQTLDGERLGSSDLDGSVSVVNFWASWCPPCRNEQKGLERVWRSYKDKGVRFVGVNLRDNKVEAQAYVDEFEVTYPSIFNKDSSIAARFRLLIPPSTYVLDRSGRVAGHIIGIVSDDQQLTALIDRVLAS